MQDNFNLFRLMHMGTKQHESLEANTHPESSNLGQNQRPIPANIIIASIPVDKAENPERYYFIPLPSHHLNRHPTINNMQLKLVLLYAFAALFSNAAANPSCTSAQTAKCGNCGCDIDVQSGKPVCWYSAYPYTPGQTLCQKDSDCASNGAQFKCTHDHTNRVSYGTDRLCADPSGCPTAKRSLVDLFARAGRIPEKKRVVIVEDSVETEVFV